ncbi:initiation factor 2 [Punctularia strigosozonata HHB-11173 SS5]|uniref:initiation factor 2 n=1 Tax=Punctularia strigosozonata (strain HHB-11173) TaxID=741275 RepID=UPI000441645F|nr:initiation factor 2 [Punctularia strigosozonata HHB-11173 SS5]EIN07762.1 initiation factor 2 [Punctularia strigosozonata HHB-11173 SS5]
MQEAGMAEEAAPEHILTSEYASLLAMEFNRNPVINDEAAFDIFPEPSTADPAKLPARPPVVTIMGHVDHGKTTLLDTLRHASVAKGEAGGITQHIGAFSVPVKSASSSSSSVKSITFLDTPGHAAFSAMRARGARVTDIVVLVVAADDGVMPQTREVIDLIKKDEGKLGVVVAINKVDKPEADVDRVQKMLLAEGLQLEVFGGDIPSVEVSGLTGAGLDQLVETLSALAEMQELRAEQDGQVQGHVLESKVHKGLGPVATVLVLRGTLKPGTHLISGLAHAKVRAMTDSAGKAVKAALPGAAVTVSGWKELPSAGEEVLSAGEGEIKRALANRERRAREERMLGDLGAINEQRRVEREVKEEDQGKDGEKDWDREREREREREGGPKELKLVIKGDVSGSVEAVAGAVQGIGNDKAVVKIVSTGVGPVTDSDVMMAKAAEGIVVAFGVNTPRSVEQTAHQNGVAIYTSDIIYRVMEEVKSRVIDLLPKVVEQRVTGEATVLQLFDIHLKQKKIMKVAGCRVVNGVLQKDKMARVVRGGATVYEGPVETLRHLKKDVQEIRKGLECGINVGAFADFQPGDLIQTYEEVVKPGQL